LVFQFYPIAKVERLSLFYGLNFWVIDEGGKFPYYYGSKFLFFIFNAALKLDVTEVPVTSCVVYTVKKGKRFRIPCRDVTNQTLPGRE
jgi:hypothetical protein